MIASLIANSQLPKDTVWAVRSFCRAIRLLRIIEVPPWTGVGGRPCANHERTSPGVPTHVYRMFESLVGYFMNYFERKKNYMSTNARLSTVTSFWTFEWKLAYAFVTVVGRDSLEQRFLSCAPRITRNPRPVPRGFLAMFLKLLPWNLLIFLNYSKKFC